MFAVYCAGCDRRELRCWRSIERIDNKSGGIIVLTIRCSGCGRRSRLVTGAGHRNGRAVRRNRAGIKAIRR